MQNFNKMSKKIITGFPHVTKLVKVFARRPLSSHLFVISVCLFGYPIITQEPLDRFTSDFD